jgi:hypothetical protein
MKSLHTRFLSALPLLSMAVFGQNLLNNPSFEAGTPSSSWQLWKADTATTAMGALTFPNTGAPDGQRFARVEVTSLPPENWQLQLQLPTEWMADSGAIYELKFMAKSDSSSSIHVGIQDGPDHNFEYRSGRDFMLSPEWTEQSLIYESDRTGNGALRFNLYVGGRLDTYSFDAFSLVKQSDPVGIRADHGNSAPGFRIRQADGNLVLSLSAAGSEKWRAELLDSRGMRHATATGHAGRPLILPQPKANGLYWIRARTASQSWTRSLSLRPASR